MTCFKGLPAESLRQYRLGLYLNKPQALWIDKTKVETNKCFTPAVKDSGGGVMIGACFAAMGPGYLVVAEPTSSSLYQSIIEPNVRPTVLTAKAWSTLSHTIGQ